jgi:hypothetical protein
VLDILLFDPDPALASPTGGRVIQLFEILGWYVPHICPIQKRSILGGLHLEDYRIAAEGICMVVREIRRKRFTHIIELLEMSNQISSNLVV